ncbi:hypothetical protein M2171_002593 [Bradyrhizobium japonicum USDA 38]|uniref:hypothetical protein n=1 Tax=Bradyrhizobium japonicum TaxID=375 RepID=UPI0003F7A3A3|nr:hypothetical protein [Bradyrhizobium japonicum]MCS3893460.1 hypothetical protein [Bradyrhizobium japonicum USDA 38]MCS3945974.1 hypothetical protein [Bradyrhizobium japonicum]
MSRRRQHTEFFGRVVSALRVIDRRRWRRRGEKLLDVDPGELDLVDNATLSDEVLCVIEDLISQALHDKVATLRAAADAAKRAARNFDGKSASRRFDVKTAKIDDMNEFVDAWALEVLADMQQKGAA